MIGAVHAFGDSVRRFVERVERGEIPRVTDDRWLPAIFVDELDEATRTPGRARP